MSLKIIKNTITRKNIEYWEDSNVLLIILYNEHFKPLSPLSSKSSLTCWFHNCRSYDSQRVYLSPWAQRIQPIKRQKCEMKKKTLSRHFINNNNTKSQQNIFPHTLLRLLFLLSHATTNLIHNKLFYNNTGEVGSQKSLACMLM